MRSTSRPLRSGRRAPTVLVASAAIALAAATAGHAQVGPPAPAATDQPAPQPKARPKARATKGPDAGPTAEDAAAAQQKAKDPTVAANAVEAGVKHLAAGKVDPAIASLTTAISSGALRPQGLARALYHRGLAYRQKGRAGEAISDLTSALWVKGGLSDTDRTAASKALADTYREAGLNEQGQVPSGQRTRTAGPSGGAAPSNGQAPAQPTAGLAPGQATAPASGTGLGTLFGGLFGTKKAPEPPPAPVEPTPAPALQPAVGTGWSSSVRQDPPPTPQQRAAAARVASPGPTAQATPSPVAPAPAVVPSPVIQGGQFRAQVAMVRSEQQARSIADRFKGALASATPGKTSEVAAENLGGMGTFFSVRVGPYASAAEATAACKQIKAAGAAATGLDCVAVSAK